MVALFLAVFLSVMQAAPPVPRQIANNSTSAGSMVQSNTIGDKTPSRSSVTATDTHAAVSDKKSTDGQTNNNAEQSVTISKLPTVTVSSPKRDWADWGYWAFNLLLVIVGGLQVVLLWGTLRIYRRQLAVPFRAYLGIIEPEKPITDRNASPNKVSAKFPIVNNGRVPARISSVDVEVIVQQRDGKELYRRSVEEKVTEGEIPPEESASYAVNVYWPFDIPNADSIVISITIKYETGFKETGKDTLSFVRVFNPPLQNWTMGYWGVDVDLTKSNNAKNPNQDTTENAATSVRVP